MGLKSGLFSEGETAGCAPAPGHSDLHGRLFVHREIIEHDDIARPQGGDKHLLDIGEKRRRWSIGPIEHGRGSEQAIEAQARQ